MSTTICQLKTYFSCNCVNCTGEVEENTSAKLSSSSSSSSSPSYTPSFSSTSSYQQHQCDNNEILNFSTTTSTSSTNNYYLDETQTQTTTLLSCDDDEEEVSDSCLSGKLLLQLETEQQEAYYYLVEGERMMCEIELLPQQRRLASLQRKYQQKHQRSFLQIAKSLQRKQEANLQQKVINNKPLHLVFNVKLSSSSSQFPSQQQLIRQHKKFRSNQKQLRRRLFKLNGPYMPNWCYEENCNSQRSLREVIANAIPGAFDELTNEPEFHVFDRRLFSDHIRLPHTSAQANRTRRNWILENRVFNCRIPFSDLEECFTTHTNTNTKNDVPSSSSSSSSSSSFIPVPVQHNKEDTRGECNFAMRTKFHGKDDSRRCHRNNGYTRNDARNNGWQGGSKWNMGNSEKTIFGKPWLFTRKNKIMKGKFRLQEFWG